ncbi:MAG: DUF2155 domain-containing protein [Hyphomicrobiales bacterium]
MKRGFAALFSLLLTSTVHAQPIENTVAVFSGLDKITATITSFEVPVNATKQFGSLRITPKICYTRPITETPKTTSFVAIDEVQLNGKVRKIFSGWMFASSPGLNAVEHGVYDVWLTNCKTPSADTSSGNN